MLRRWLSTSTLFALVAFLALLLIPARAQSRRTLTDVWQFPLVVCDQGAVSSVLVSSKGTLFPVAACNVGTNVVTSELEFLDTEIDSIWIQRALPSDWRPTVDLALKWKTAATTGNAVWQVQTVCVGDAETIDPAMNAAQTITDAAKGTTLQVNDASLSSVTMTGCAAGDTLHVRIYRDPAHASDTIAASAFLRSLALTIRRSVAVE